MMVGDGHQFVHVRGETEDVRRMLAIVRGEFAPQFFIAAGDGRAFGTGREPCRVR